MDLKPSEFVDNAPSEVGKLVRINHTDCPAGLDRKKRLYIKRVDDKIIAYCHNCGCKGIYTTTTHKPRNISVLKNLHNKVEHTVTVQDVKFPKDFTTNLMEFSKEALDWLRKYIDVAAIKAHSIGYSPSMQRVILPVFNDDGVLIFWQGRSLCKEHTPKYYNMKSVDKPYMHLIADAYDDRCVVVEDILSAINLHSNGYNAVALLGTSISTALAVELKDMYNAAFVWLDDDTGGHRGSLKVADKLRPLLDKVHVIRVPIQPKEADTTTLDDIIYAGGEYD